MDELVEILIGRFLCNGQGRAEANDTEARVCLVAEPRSYGKIGLTGVYYQRAQTSAQWHESSSMIIGFLDSLDEVASWLGTEEGNQRIQDCFQMLVRVYRKNPLEDWDW